MFGNNRSVVTSATIPHSTLRKRHNILAFHWQLGLLGKADLNGCTDPGVKEMDSKLLHFFSVADIPTTEDECLEAVQSNLTGPMLFSDRYVGDVAL